MIKNNLKMFELNKELKKADGIIFSPTENLEIEPSVVILVFKSKEKSDKIRDALNVKNSEYNLVIIKENDNINISIIAKHINEVFNIDKLPYNKYELLKFDNIQPKNGKFVFGIGYFRDGQLIFPIEESQNPKLIIFSGYELN